MLVRLAPGRMGRRSGVETCLKTLGWNGNKREHLNAGGREGGVGLAFLVTDDKAE